MKCGGPKRHLHAEHLLMLTSFLLTYPEATMYECKAFIYCNTTNNIVVSEVTISRALKSIGFSRKKASHVVTQASAPINLQRRENFWTKGYPYGIIDTPRRRIIDSDECGFHLTDCNRKYGYALSGVRVIKKGNYSRSTKITLIASIKAGNPTLPPHIKGSRQNPRIWFRINAKPGTTTEDYRSYIQAVMNSFPNDEPQRTFMHDNLSSHTHNSIRDSIHNKGHRVVRRPPYFPGDAPIEYFFNTLEALVRNRGGHIATIGGLIHLLTTIINTINATNGYFDHCGYPE